MNVFRQPREIPAKALLASCSLPTSDLQPQHFQHFFASGSHAELTGVIGMEFHGEVALLRSLAVAELARGQGLAQRLVVAAEAHARSNGVRDIYLLTNTAEGFFRALGYSVLAREAVPTAIRATSEYTSLCPASASVLVKHVGA